MSKASRYPPTLIASATLMVFPMDGRKSGRNSLSRDARFSDLDRGRRSARSPFIEPGLESSSTCECVRCPNHGLMVSRHTLKGFDSIRCRSPGRLLRVSLVRVDEVA